jgi:exosortase/archaeosortase family protein
LVTCVAAYHYSLESLFQTVAFDTPLAYVGLVPFIALALAFAQRRPGRPEPRIQDRQLDYIIGVPLIGIALAINEFLPRQQSVLYWMRREDLLSLPFFVAGAVTILFGTRVMWRQKIAICYLFLAWPWPYTTILLGTLNGFTNVTVWGLTGVLHVVHLATPIGSNGESGLFSIVHHGQSFPVSVVSACSGVDGMVGFLLVGTAFAAIVQGPRLRKTIWLAVGLVLLWATNLFRLLLIFWAGKQWGEHVAISTLHPVVGLLIFNVGVVLMVLLLRPFGLRLRAINPSAGQPSASGGPTPPRPTTPIFMVSGLLAIVALFSAANNNALRSFDLVATASGEPRLASFLADPATPPGWAPQFTTEYEQNKSLFGESSRWFRYTYFYHGGGDLSGTLPVTADVINAAGVSSFNAYGVSACYNFHGYTLRDVSQVSLGAGMTGDALSYSSSTDGDWSVVYWIWPVKTGTQNRYERVILYLADTTLGDVHVTGQIHGITGLKNALSPSDSTDQRLIVNRAFLVQFARELILGQSRIHAETTDIAHASPPLPPVPSVVPSPHRPGKPTWAMKWAQIQQEIHQRFAKLGRRSSGH